MSGVDIRDTGGRDAEPFRRRGMMAMMFTERRTKMRWPKIGLLLVTLLYISAIPLSAGAFELQFCVPNCSAADAIKAPPKSESGAPVENPAGVFTTTLDFTGANAITVAGFTITGKAIAQQSGTLQKITLTSPTKIIAPSAAGSCTTTTPCSIQIIATSAPDDFPLPKPEGGYPAGAVLSGYFLGPQNVYPGIGDWASMTAEAGGLSTDLLTVLNSDVINATTGGSTNDTATSLPKSCTGNPTCKFIVTSSVRSTSTSIQETVQQRCDAQASVINGVRHCRTRLKTTLNLSFVVAGDSFTAPLGVVTVDPPDEGQTTNPVALLIGETLPPFGNLDVRHLAVGSNDFALDATIKLDAGNSIDPQTEEVYVRVGSFTMTIPKDSFKRRGGRLVFGGKVAGLDVAAAFERDSSDPALWKFAVGVHGLNLKPLLPTGVLEVPVDIAVDIDKGSDLVTPRFF